MILPLEQSVVSRELAEKMKAKGFPQDTYFFYSVPTIRSLEITPQGKIALNHWVIPPTDSEWFLRFAAPTSAEIGEVLKKTNHLGVTAFSKIEGKWWANGGEWNVTKQQYNGLILAQTEAEARGLLWLWLKEREWR